MFAVTQEHDIMDRALAILEGTAPEYSGGLSNHAPMAAEACLHLRRAGRVLPWVEFYRNRLYARPQQQSRITGENWPQAIGDISRYSDWEVFFQERIGELGWEGAVGRWVPVLAPGSIAAGGHGLIRTSHAVRSLCCKRTGQRESELAAALAFWAARFQELPGKAATSPGSLPASEAVKKLPLVPEEKKVRFGLISKKIRALESFPPFQEAVNLIRLSGGLSDSLSGMTEAFCSAYLAGAKDAKTSIILIHTVTIPAAVRALLPFLGPNAAAEAVRCGWQAAAAIHSVFGKGPGRAGFRKVRPGIDELIDRAVGTGDEHAIKFTDACLGEYRLNPEPVYLAAALDATGRLDEISKFIGG